MLGEVSAGESKVTITDEAGGAFEACGAARWVGYEIDEVTENGAARGQCPGRLEVANRPSQHGSSERATSS
ncbi:MAG: hypothetical protein ACRDWE_00875 [Acidimicrobiales bacterium]